MAGGSWNGSENANPGDIPAHPCAWCKADQEWVSVVNHTSTQNVNIRDVKESYEVHRLWKEGEPSSEYFLVENRQRERYDSELPGEGLLVYHIDDSLDSNSDEAHYMVALEQADANFDLEFARNRGDEGDAYPGPSGNRRFDRTSVPNSKSYNGVDTRVAITDISDAGPVMSAQFTVQSGELPQIRSEPVWDAYAWQNPPSTRGRAMDSGEMDEVQFAAGELDTLDARVTVLERLLGVPQPFVDRSPSPRMDFMQNLLREGNGQDDNSDLLTERYRQRRQRDYSDPMSPGR
jgi:hypothetical protein